MLCTEFMARSLGSTFEACLPVLKQCGVGAYCWGFVQGRCQTHLPWDSWRGPYHATPTTWFHDVLRPDGSPYSAAEVAAIRELCF